MSSIHRHYNNSQRRCRNHNFIRNLLRYINRKNIFYARPVNNRLRNLFRCVCRRKIN